MATTEFKGVPYRYEEAEENQVVNVIGEGYGLRTLESLELALITVAAVAIFGMAATVVNRSTPSQGVARNY
ncbi:MAG: hypothetical protein AAB439_02370 [Patescibacteria group bacterium]|mgnify:CR=1 FL=1